MACKKFFKNNHVKELLRKEIGEIKNLWLHTEYFLSFIFFESKPM